MLAYNPKTLKLLRSLYITHFITPLKHKIIFSFSSFTLLSPFFSSSLLSIVIGSLRNKGGAKEVQVEIINVEEEMKKKIEKSSGEIPPLDVKDYEDLGLIWRN